MKKRTEHRTDKLSPLAKSGTEIILRPSLMGNAPRLNTFAAGVSFIIAGMSADAVWVWFDMPSNPWRDASGAFAWNNSFCFMVMAAVFTAFGIWRALKVK